MFYICYSDCVAVGVGIIRGFMGFITEVAFSIPVNPSINQTARPPITIPKSNARIVFFDIFID